MDSDIGTKGETVEVPRDRAGRPLWRDAPRDQDGRIVDAVRFALVDAGPRQEAAGPRAHETAHGRDLSRPRRPWWRVR